MPFIYWLNCHLFVRLPFIPKPDVCASEMFLQTRKKQIIHTSFFTLTWLNLIHERIMSTWKSSHLEKVWELQRIWACRVVEMSRNTQEKLYYVPEQDKLQQTVCELDSVQTCCELVPTNITTFYDYALLACNVIQFGRHVPTVASFFL